jgi:hypothetical protein
LVNVTARILEGRVPFRTRWAIRVITTRVLPVPAPAKTSSGPGGASTASDWAAFMPGTPTRRGGAGRDGAADWSAESDTGRRASGADET